MTEDQIVNFLFENYDYFRNNNIVSSIFRSIGWTMVKWFNFMIKACKGLYNYTFGMVDITQWSGLNSFLEEYDPLIRVFLFASLVVLGFMFLFGKNKKHNLVSNLLIFAIVVTSSNYLFSQLNLWTITFKDAVIGTGQSGQSDGMEFVNTYLYDLLYIDEQIGLGNLKAGEDVPQAKNITEEELSFIDMSEVINYDADGLTDDAKDILKKILVFKANGKSGLKDVYNGVAWTDTFNTFYYRYSFLWMNYFLAAISLLLIYVCLSFKNIKIILEIFTSRILVTIKAADMSSSKKTVTILCAIRDGYYALCFTAISIRIYFLFAEYLNTQTQIPSIGRAIVLLFIAICVIDGANIMEKISGTDAGLSSFTGKIVAGYYAARGLGNMLHSRGGNGSENTKTNEENRGNHVSNIENASDTDKNFSSMDQSTANSKNTMNEDNVGTYNEEDSTKEAVNNTEKEDPSGASNLNENAEYSSMEQMSQENEQQNGYAQTEEHLQQMDTELEGGREESGQPYQEMRDSGGQNFYEDQTKNMFERWDRKEEKMIREHLQDDLPFKRENTVTKENNKEHFKETRTEGRGRKIENSRRKDRWTEGNKK